jgi:Glyoxalase-like domain
MHRSRIGVVLIDHPTESWDQASGFWAGVRGSDLPDITDEDPYASLDRLPGEVMLDLQRTGSGTPPRVHLDVATDDVPAEIARLEGLGARIETHHEGWAVMTDPGGLVFCVVPVQTGPAAFAEHATVWP